MFDCLPNQINHCLPPTYAIVAKTDRCPADLNNLVELLRRDLPSYANRLLQRRRKLKDPFYSSVVMVGKPEFEPLPISHREYTPIEPQAAPKQVFISTLERQYTGVKSTELQQFYWLFLTPTPHKGWRLAAIYSRISPRPKSQDSPISPPIESSSTPVGEAIRIWLNDCYLGRIGNWYSHH